MSQRKRLPPKEKKFPQKAPKRNYFAELAKTPEGRQKLSEYAKTKGTKKRGRPVGVPDGHSAATIAPIRKKAKIEAKRVVKIMSEKFNIEDQYEKEALETAVEVMRMDGQVRERLAAARLVLDFTKSKPATKSDVSISKAEDFLASLLIEEQSDHEQEIKGSPKETSH